MLAVLTCATACGFQEHTTLECKASPLTHARAQTKDTTETVTAELGSKYGKEDVDVLRSQLERNISRCTDLPLLHACRISHMIRANHSSSYASVRHWKLTRLDSLRTDMDMLSKRLNSDLGDVREEMRVGLERKLDVAPFEEKFRLGFGGAQVKKRRGQGLKLSKRSPSGERWGESLQRVSG